MQLQIDQLNKEKTDLQDKVAKMKVDHKNELDRMELEYERTVRNLKGQIHSLK